MESLDNNDEELDPHYKQMLAYKEVPSWWYVLILALSMLVALFCIYDLKSTLPWWGFHVACTLSFGSTLFFGLLLGLIGFSVPITGLVRLIGGKLHPGKPIANMYFVLFGANAQLQAVSLIECLKLGQYGKLHPGKPIANMYFVLFGANAQLQAVSLIESLKLGQYGKLSPRCTLTVQMMGTVFGAIINYILMSSITTNQREILLSIQGTNIWSGQNIQSFNSLVSFSSSKALISDSVNNRFTIGHCIRRPLKLSLQHRSHLPMDRARPPPRPSPPPSFLLGSPCLPKNGLQLRCYPSHLLVSRLPLSWHQLLGHGCLRPRLLCAILRPQALP